MIFTEAESYLLSLGNEVETMKLGLENIRRLLAELGDPQTRYGKVQVAGTNGKGSVCAFLDSICREAGIRTGLYTSPHLVSMTERIRINGIDISEEEFARLATVVRDASENLVHRGRLEYTPTFFEQVTAIGLLAFAEANVELAILETGLGGRYDATTAANAEIAVITRIDLDHQEYLGNTIEEIAEEKAGIVREMTRAVVIGPQSPQAGAVIEARVAERGCAAFNVEGTLSLLFPPSAVGLSGRHQIENAAIAVQTALVLREGSTISDDAIRKGLENARHPGRLERIGNFLLDGAHNPSGARALRAYLDEFVSEPVTLVFGAMQDKNVREILGILMPKATHMIFTEPSNSRSMKAVHMFDLVSDILKQRRVSLSGSAEEAIRIAERETSSSDVILVTGSLYLVGEVRKLLNN